MGAYIFYNGRILTMDRDQKEVEAIVVKDEKICYTGKYMGAKDMAGNDAVKINLKGRSLIPGLNDSHMHLLSYGFNQYKVDLRNAKSIGGFQEVLRSFLSEETTQVFKEWIVGYGWNNVNFLEKRLPRKEDLDAIEANRPIFMARACYHIGVVNSKALEIAGITKKTKDPEGGKIDRHPETGEPTGILRENAIYMVYNKIPFTEDIEGLKEILVKSIADANKVGITSIQTDDFSHINAYTQVIKAYEALRESGELQARINLQMLFDHKDKLETFLTKGIKTGDGDEWLRYGPLKVLADGSLGSRTAALVTPYSDDATTKGMLIYEDQALEDLLTMGHLNGLQLAVHAIGDRCMEQVLTSYEHIAASYPSKDPRFRIIHAQIGSEEVLNRFKKLDVIADIQPIFIKTDMDMAEDRIGKERMKWSYAWGKMIRSGIRVSGSSDAPVEPFDPLLGIYTAVTRKNLMGHPTEGWYPGEKLSLWEALELYTINAAYSTYEEGIKGKIKENMLADLVLLSEDITQIDEDEIKDISVDMTMVGGEIVYKR